MITYGTSSSFQPEAYYSISSDDAAALALGCNSVNHLWVRDTWENEQADNNPFGPCRQVIDKNPEFKSIKTTHCVLFKYSYNARSSFCSTSGIQTFSGAIPIVVKVMKPSPRTTRVWNQMRAEIATYCRLNSFEFYHPYILNMHAFLPDKILAVEYMPFDMVDLVNETDFSWKLHASYQMVSALVWLHRIGILHRDIKLDNYMVNGQLSRENYPNLKLGDFGTAVLFDSNVPESLTRQELPHWDGTYGFSIPSEIREKRKISSDNNFEKHSPTLAMDKYALGIMLLDFFAPPLESDSDSGFAKLNEDPIDELSRLSCTHDLKLMGEVEKMLNEHPTLPKKLKDIITNLIVTNPIVQLSPDNKAKCAEMKAYKLDQVENMLDELLKQHK